MKFDSVEDAMRHRFGPAGQPQASIDQETVWRAMDLGAQRERERAEQEAAKAAEVDPLLEALKRITTRNVIADRGGLEESGPTSVLPPASDIPLNTDAPLRAIANALGAGAAISFNGDVQ